MNHQRLILRCGGQCADPQPTPEYIEQTCEPGAASSSLRKVEAALISLLLAWQQDSAVGMIARRVDEWQTSLRTL